MLCCLRSALPGGCAVILNYGGRCSRSNSNPPCHPDTPACPMAQTSLPLGPRAPWELPPGSARVCVCVHLCDVYPYAVQLRSHGPTNTLCYGSLQAELSPGSYRTHGALSCIPQL